MPINFFVMDVVSNGKKDLHVGLQVVACGGCSPVQVEGIIKSSQSKGRTYKLLRECVKIMLSSRIILDWESFPS